MAAAPTDKEVTYTLEVRPHSDKRTELIIAEDCTQNSYSWESDGYVNPEDNSCTWVQAITSAH